MVQKSPADHSAGLFDLVVQDRLEIVAELNPERLWLVDETGQCREINATGQRVFIGDIAAEH